MPRVAWAASSVSSLAASWADFGQLLVESNRNRRGACNSPASSRPEILDMDSIVPDRPWDEAKEPLAALLEAGDG